jgi:hypothetical protein
MQQEIETLRSTSGALSGRLSIGVIQSALPMAGLIGRALRDHHPEVELMVLSQSSIEILRNLEDFSIEHSVGLVAVDRDPVSPLVLAAFDCARITEPPAISRKH